MKMKIVVFALGLILLVGMGLCGCGNKEITGVAANDSIPKFQKLESSDEEAPPADALEDDAVVTTELIALADTREEAEEIAELYGIELSTYSSGVATYTTDKNASELIEMGAENGYPALSPNYENKLYTEQ